MRQGAVLALVLLVPALVAPALAQRGDAPLAFFTITPQTGKTGGTFAADAGESLPGANATRIVEHAWRWSADEEFVVGNATANHTYRAAGVFVVTLRVRDDAGGEATASQTVLVSGTKPMPYFTAIVIASEGLDTTIEVNATFSDPSTGASRIVKYEWKFGDVPNEAFVEGDVVMRHTYHDAGRFTVTLRVTDDEGRVDEENVPVQIGSSFTARLLKLWADREGFMRGTWITIKLAVISVLAGFFVAIVLALLRISRFPLLSWPATAWIEIIRGTPLLVQVLIAWLVLPYLGLKLPIFWAGALALIVNTSAYQAEVLRAGIQSIPSGQMEAALAMGMSYGKAMRHVILPQAFRLVIPPLGNEFIILLKDTSLVSVIGVVDLTLVGRIFSARTFLVLETWLGVAAIYFVLTYSMALGLRALEKRLAIPGLGLPTGGAH